MSNEKKYVVYENDLKFRSNRNIDPEKADWFDEKTKKKYSTDQDNLEYRLRECQKSNFSFLDLSHLKLSDIPKLSNEIFYKIKYLFLNDNNLENIGDNLNQFIDLEVLDISCNKIKQISKLPTTIKEFVCHNNKLETIPKHKHITKIDCSHNFINLLNEYPELKDIICHDNKLSNIPTYKNATRIICKNNPLTHIHDQPNVSYIDCSKTDIVKLVSSIPNLTHLVCNDTKINDVSNLKNLVVLEILGCNNLTKLPYLPNLQDLLFQNTIQLMIESKYKVEKCINQKHHTFVRFLV